MDIITKIRTEKLSFCYKGTVVLDAIDLQFPEKSIIAVSGPSGAGKSTFLAIFNRLWEMESGGVVSGKVWVDLAGKMIDIYSSDLSVAELRQKIGMVFQAPNPLPMSVYKNISFPLQLNGKVGKRQMSDKVEQALRKAHLFDEVKDRLNSDARRLSGGQQQRLCIARALMLDPEILLLDEPTSSLDAKGCEKIEHLLIELKEQCTLLLVSHYQDQIRRIADRGYELENKQLQRTF
jgi:phosphate transport system ATP-binding protein